ncbi:ABC transporter ATP-binding protein [Paenibacillus koleovorans]|uniref:ABC transporter ATP-binding protein n=1 Tax=Paenibacillus koleovorans TaxID=121608 RepID=UPI0013E3030C|nr:ABC transporter ATP-binding protein [Paenibacillus koleovorans]
MSTSLPSAADRKRITAYLRKAYGPYRANIALIVLKNVVGSLLFMIPPLLSKYMLERVLPQQDVSLLVAVALCMILVPITGSMIILLENRWSRFMLTLSAQGRTELYEGIQRKPLAWHRRQTVGDLTTRLLDDTHRITDQAFGHVGFYLFHIVTIAAGCSILLFLHPLLAAVVLSVWIGQTLLLSRLSRYAKNKAAQVARQNSAVAETVRELVSAAGFLKANGQEDQAMEKVNEFLRREWEATRSGVLTDHRVSLLQAALNALSLVLMYTAGGYLVLRGALTIGGLVAFIAVFNWLRPFGMAFISRTLTLQKLSAAVERVAEVAFAGGTSAETEMVAGRRIPSGPVTVEVLGLSSRRDGRAVLEQIDLSLTPGSVTSLVGHRGSGKSTFAELLLGLEEPTAGLIRLNGIPLAEIDLNWLRRHMLGVTQEVMLRSGTIRDNIAYGLEKVDPQELQNVMRVTELADWIARLPDGLDTRVGEQALQLSGGERQRISIARALLRRPSVLILDESTSALDQGTERRLLDKLLAEHEGMTLLFITHRLDVAQRSDQILVLHEGRLAERGTHEALLAKPGLYYALWEAGEAR